MIIMSLGYAEAMAPSLVGNKKVKTKGAGAEEAGVSWESSVTATQ